MKDLLPPAMNDSGNLSSVKKLFYATVKGGIKTYHVINERADTVSAGSTFRVRHGVYREIPPWFLVSHLINNPSILQAKFLGPKARLLVEKLLGSRD